MALIETQRVIDRINKQRESLNPDIFPQDKIGDSAYKICIEFIERMPEEIVRCKDCDYWYERKGEMYCGEMYFNQDDPDFYCGYAERRADGSD